MARPVHVGNCTPCSRQGGSASHSAHRRLQPKARHEPRHRDAAALRDRGENSHSGRSCCRISWLKGGCRMRSRSAARVKCNSSATPAKYRMSRRSTANPYAPHIEIDVTVYWTAHRSATSFFPAQTDQPVLVAQERNHEHGRRRVRGHLGRGGRKAHRRRQPERPHRGDPPTRRMPRGACPPAPPSRGSPKYAYPLIKGGVGHNMSQETPHARTPVSK